MSSAPLAPSRGSGGRTPPDGSRRQGRQDTRGAFNPRTTYRRALGKLFARLFFAATLTGIVTLVALLVGVWRDGAGSLTLGFLTSFPSRFASQAGILPALVGSLWIMALTLLIAFPLGVGTAIWLEEYAPRGRLLAVVQTNIANLAGVPSVVYGILGLALFVRTFALGRSILAGSLTLALLILPVIIIAAQEAIRAVPGTIRQGALALGATRWQTVRHQILPVALPGILTGTILAISRAVGETAPLIMVGALGFVPFIPSGPGDGFTVLPVQIYNWISRPPPEFHALAAAGLLALPAVPPLRNAAAIILRNKFSKRL
jgi:phosphate transport system permease protein